MEHKDFIDKKITSITKIKHFYAFVRRFSAKNETHTIINFIFML